MKERIVAALGILLFAANAALVQAAPRVLPLRYECGACIYKATTSFTIETNYGASPLVLPFTGSTNFDFYSAGTVCAQNVTTKDTAGGVLSINNASTSNSKVIVVVGRMRFYDYDWTTGGEVLIGDTGHSPSRPIRRGQIENITLPTTPFLINRCMAHGHLLHICVSISLVNNHPGKLGQLLYNGPQGQATSAVIAQNSGIDWNLTGPPAPLVCMNLQPDGSANVGCGSLPNRSYLLLSSPDLSPGSWVTVSTNSAGPTGIFWQQDAGAKDCPRRFYRAMLCGN